MVPLQPVEPLRLGAGAQLAAGLLGQSDRSSPRAGRAAARPPRPPGAAPPRTPGPARACGSAPRPESPARPATARPVRPGPRAPAPSYPATCLGGGQAEPTGEDREPTQQPLLVPGQQVVAPVQRRGHGPVPFRPVPAADQAEGRAQPVEQGRRRQQPGVSGGQLEGQRQAVQPPADRGHRGRGGRGELQAGVHRTSALQEHLSGRRCGDRGDIARTRQGERAGAGSPARTGAAAEPGWWPAPPGRDTGPAARRGPGQRRAGAPGCPGRSAAGAGRRTRPPPPARPMAAPGSAPARARSWAGPVRPRGRRPARRPRRRPGSPRRRPRRRRSRAGSSRRHPAR